MVERVLCKHEVVGSIPSASTTITLRRRGCAIEESDKFASRLTARCVDIVKEGSARRLQRFEG